jgi:SAV_6107-like HEPN
MSGHRMSALGMSGDGMSAHGRTALGMSAHGMTGHGMSAHGARATEVAMNAGTAAGCAERPRVAPSIMMLLESARHGLAAAATEPSAATRYVAAHLAALRAAAAVVSARAEPGGTRRRGPRSVWELLPRVAPALTEWAAFFAAGAAKRAAAEAGLPRAVTAREADDLLRDSETFLGLVEEVLGVLAA